MADFVAKITKHCPETLEPGEDLVAATVAQPVGSLARQAGFGSFGLVGALVGVAKSKRDQRKATEAAAAAGLALDAGTAATVPDVATVVGVTDRRLLFYKQGALSGAPKELLAALPRSSVARVDYEAGRLKGVLSVVFDDNSVKRYEVVRSARPQALVDAFTGGAVR